MRRLLTALFMVSAVQAAEFPPGAKVEMVDDFTGGLNTTSHPDNVANNYSVNMRNLFVHRTPGNLVKRPGYVSVGSTSTLSRINFGFTFNKSDGSKEYMVSDSSVMLTTEDFSTYVLVSSAMNPNTQLSCAQNGYKVYCANGVDSVFTWNGTSKVILDGTKGTPNVPKFKYVASHLNRIWGGNTVADPSSLDWSAVTSTGGAILTPDHFLAWPSINNLSIGIGDGETLNALWVYKGQLQVGKDDSVYTIYGDKDSNFLARKTVAQAGVSSNDSVVNLDGVSYYKGRDGIYAYNGVEAVRISDLIQPDVATMQDPTLQEIQSVWDSQTDFNRGSFSGSTTTSDGFLTVISTTYGTCIPSQGCGGLADNYLRPDGSIPESDETAVNLELKPGTTFYGPFQMEFSQSVRAAPDNAKLVLNEVIFSASAHGDFGCGLKFGSMTVVNRFNGSMIVSTITPADSPSDGQYHFPFTHQDLSIDGVHLNNSSLSVKIDGCNFAFSGLTQAGGNIGLKFKTATTAQYVSDVTTLTSITAWANFNTGNTGNVSYFTRASTSAVNITTKTWTNQGSGSIINESTINNYIQWAATITQAAPPSAVGPLIDFVKVSHFEGQGSISRPIGIDWKNEYWLSISTDLANSLRLQYVKSWITNKIPNAWNVLSGINVASLWKDGATTLYGGSSTSGTTFRLDYGTNDNGTAIDAFYDTPYLLRQTEYGSFLNKKMYEIWVDAEAEEGNILQLGTSFNSGSFTTQNVDLSGTSRQLKILGNNKVGKYVQLRLRNNQMDKGFGVNAVGLVYQPLTTR